MAADEPQISAYLHAKGAKLGLPVSGTFELTRKCNFNCKMCYVHTTDTSKDEELTADEWLKIAEDAKKEGLLFLLLTGGEPLLRKDFSYLYTELSKMGIVISVNTNGSLITEQIFDLFKKYPPARVNVSLYGASEETYENLCENKKFGVVYENLKKLKNAGFSVRLNCAFNKYNSKDTEKIYKIANELGLIIKPASYMYPPLRSKGETGENEARLTAKDAAINTLLCRKLTFTSEQLKAKAEQMAALQMPDCIDDSQGDGIKCRAGKCSFWITFDGKMTACGMMNNECGDLKTQQFKDVWQSTLEFSKQIRMPIECNTCIYKSVCNVCAAMCLAETGEFGKKPQYVCNMMKNIVDGFKNKFGEGSHNAD